MDQKANLAQTMLSMIRYWQQGNEKACYREFFVLDVDDRRVVEEAFKQAIKQYLTPAARKDAKGIYKLIRKNFKNEVILMTDTLKKLLQHWFFSGKEVFYDHFAALGTFEKDAMLGGLREIVADSDNEEFRQAARDIPVYIQSRQ